MLRRWRLRRKRIGREGNKNQNLKCRNFHGALVEVQKDNKKASGIPGLFCCNALVIYIYFAILMLDRRCGNGKGKSYIKDGQ